MNTLIQADIFFFITAIAVVVCTAAFLVAAWYVIQILRDVREISTKAKNAAGKLEVDFETLRADLKHKGTKVGSIADMILAFIASWIPHPKKKKAEKNDVI
ncbi:MAG: hypothetical protein KBC74_00370 [Candidatus Pacebacteria bacterium]|nr:hypothetical protein [Candidatus Paceibacterota bacterium]MBP9831967.1 hypothetical protein [Candidatus Paceibacterota bacterium]